MLSEIIKGSLTPYCSIRSGKLVVKSPCNVARGWVGSCVITIKTLRELAAYTEANALLMTRTAGGLARRLP
jgi:hypothetical protein